MLATAAPTTNPMERPVMHRHCDRVFDLARVQPAVKHADCVAYQCPYCGMPFDDRADGRGGIERL